MAQEGTDSMGQSRVKGAANDRAPAAVYSHETMAELYEYAVRHNLDIVLSRTGATGVIYRELFEHVPDAAPSAHTRDMHPSHREDAVLV